MTAIHYFKTALASFTQTDRNFNSRPSLATTTAPLWPALLPGSGPVVWPACRATDANTSRSKAQDARHCPRPACRQAGVLRHFGQEVHGMPDNRSSRYPSKFHEATGPRSSSAAAGGGTAKAANNPPAAIEKKSVTCMFKICASSAPPWTLRKPPQRGKSKPSRRMGAAACRPRSPRGDVPHLPRRMLTCLEERRSAW